MLRCARSETECVGGEDDVAWSLGGDADLCGCWKKKKKKRGERGKKKIAKCRRDIEEGRGDARLGPDKCSRRKNGAAARPGTCVCLAGTNVKGCSWQEFTGYGGEL